MVLPYFKEMDHCLFCSLFFGGRSGCRCFVNYFRFAYSRSSFFSACFLATAATTCFLGRFSSSLCGCTFTVDLVKVNQFNQRRFSVIAYTDTQLDDAGITTGTTGNFRRNYCKQFLYSCFIFQVAENHPVIVADGSRILVVLGLGDQWFNVHPQGFGLCEGRYHTFVLDQLATEVGQQRFSVCLFTAERILFVTVIHDDVLFLKHLHRVKELQKPLPGQLCYQLIEWRLN
jgi:hypothetical protein